MRKFYRSLLKEVLEGVIARFRGNLTEGSLPDKLLKRHGITKEVLEDFRVGFATSDWASLADWASEQETYVRDCLLTMGLLRKGKRGFYDRFRNRVVLPVYDRDGDPVGLTSRSLPSLRKRYKPKKFDEALLNSSHSPIFDKWKYVAGYRRAREAVETSGQLIVTRDPIDLLGLRSRGHHDSVMELIPGSFDRVSNDSQQRDLLDRSVELEVLIRGEKPANNPDG